MTERKSHMELGSLINLPTFDYMREFGEELGAAFEDTKTSGRKISKALVFNGIKFRDADAGLVLARTLEQIDPTIFQLQFPELAAMNSGFRVDNTGGKVATSVVSRRQRPVGEFKIAGDRDVKGRISLAQEESTIKVYSKETTCEWTSRELARVAAEGRNLQNEFFGATNEVYMREIDEIVLTGGDTQNEGLLNHSDIDTEAAGGTIQTRTAQQMYDEIADLINDQRNNVNNTPQYMANTVTMPIDVMNVISPTILNTAAGPMSVLAALKLNFPEITKWQASYLAETNGPSGLSATMCYNNSPQAGLIRIPQPLEIGMIYNTGSFDQAFDAAYSIAGFDILEPKAFRIKTGL